VGAGEKKRRKEGGKRRGAYGKMLHFPEDSDTELKR